VLLLQYCGVQEKRSVRKTAGICTVPVLPKLDLHIQKFELMCIFLYSSASALAHHLLLFPYSVSSRRHRLSFTYVAAICITLSFAGGLTVDMKLRTSLVQRSLPHHIVGVQTVFCALSVIAQGLSQSSRETPTKLSHRSAFKTYLTSPNTATHHEPQLQPPSALRGTLTTRC
jgi:hypothetical protein